MTNNQYNLGLAIFFIVYAIFEPLTNVLLKRLRPSVFIPVITIAWVSGAAQTLQNSCTNHVAAVGNLHDDSWSGA